MRNEKVYLTFQTDRETSEFLTFFAHLMGTTQPKLINELCKDFKEKVDNYLKEIEKKQAKDKE